MKRIGTHLYFLNFMQHGKKLWLLCLLKLLFYFIIFGNISSYNHQVPSNQNKSLMNTFMKKLVIVLVVLFLATAVFSQDTTEDANIKKVIEGETLAFANADLTAWSDYFVHESYVRWSVSPTMYFDGWDALYKGAKAFLENNSGRKDADALHKINRIDWDIHINGNVALVKFVQTWEGNPGPSQQFRVLERTNGKWKISMLVAVQ